MKKKYRFGLLPILLALALPFFLRLAYLHVPLERDEGAYAYGAWRMSQGEVMYRDMVDFSPPGIFFIYAAGLSLFGDQIDDLRFFTCFYMEIVLIWMLVFARRLFNNRAAWLATLMLGVTAMEPSVLGFTSNKETFLLLPIVASMHLCMWGLEENNHIVLFISGLIGGAGFLIKQTMVLFIIGLVCYAFIYCWKTRGLHRALSATLVYGAGIGAFVGAAALYFYGNDALQPFYYWVFRYPLEFGGAVASKKEMLPHLWERLTAIASGDASLWIVCLLGLTVLCRQRAWGGLMILCAGIALLGTVCAGFRFRQHYFIVLTPVISLAAGWGMSYCLDRMNDLKNKMLKIGLSGGLIVFVFGMPLYANWAYLFVYTPHEISRRIYGANPFAESPSIAEYIRKNTKEDDTIYVVGSEAQIYFYAQRKNPTRHLFFYPLTAQYGTPKLFQQESVSAVKEARPVYIIWMNIQTSLYASTPAEERYIFDSLSDMIQSDYQLDGYVLIGRHESQYHYNVSTIDPAHMRENIPIYLYKRKTKDR